MKEQLKEKLSHLHWMKEVLSAVSSCLSNAKESGACVITDKRESVTNGYGYYNIVVIV